MNVKLTIKIENPLEGKIIVNKILGDLEIFEFSKEKKEYELPIWLIAIFRRVGVIPYDLDSKQLYDLIKQLNIEQNFEEEIQKIEQALINEAKLIYFFEVEIGDEILKNKLINAFSELMNDTEAFLRLYFFNLFLTDNAKLIYQKILKEREIEERKKLMQILERAIRLIKVGCTISELESRLGSDNLSSLVAKGYLSLETVPKITLSALEEIAQNSILHDLGFRIEKVDIKELQKRIHYTYKFEIMGDEILSFFEVVKIGEAYFIVDWITKKIIIPIKVNGRNQEEIKEPNLPESIANILEISFSDLNLSYEELFDSLLGLSKKVVYFENESDYLFFVAKIILSWIQEISDSMPFLRFLQQYRTGKTTALTFLYYFMYRALLTATVTPAVIPRLAHYHNASLLLDETKAYLTEDSEDDILSILRARYKRGATYTKARQGSESDTLSLEVFGCTVISGREPLPVDVEDRCIRLSLFPAPKGWKSQIHRIKESERKSLLTELNKIRLAVCSDLELLKRMREEVLEVRDALIDAGFDQRFAEITAPLLYIIPKKYRKEAIERLKTLTYERRSEESTQLTALIVSVLDELFEQAETDETALIKFAKKGIVKKIPFARLVEKIIEKSLNLDLNADVKLHILESERRKWETRIGKELSRLKITRRYEHVGNAKINTIFISDQELKSLKEKYLEEPKINEIDINKLPSFPFESDEESLEFESKP